MKITLITLDNWGFNAYVVKELIKQGHQVNHIDFDKFRYEYPSSWKRISNFFSKTFLKKNVKKEVLHNKIEEQKMKCHKKSTQLCQFRKFDRFANVYALIPSRKV